MDFHVYSIQRTLICQTKHDHKQYNKLLQQQQIWKFVTNTTPLSKY